MRERLEQRLEELRQELAKGQQMHAELDQRRQALAEMLMRIRGAIQVLEEELTREASALESEADNASPETPTE
jgi:hypothetical protein